MVVASEDEPVEGESKGREEEERRVRAWPAGDDESKLVDPRTDRSKDPDSVAERTDGRSRSPFLTHGPPRVERGNLRRSNGEANGEFYSVYKSTIYLQE